MSVSYCLVAVCLENPSFSILDLRSFQDSEVSEELLCAPPGQQKQGDIRCECKNSPKAREKGTAERVETASERMVQMTENAKGGGGGKE
ncbi:hypothetical protein VZT92_026776 [Zoarces viviparus]|uniref:Uncharacterized protein n=1 Tax=Zoarces viviparus TaxID=48416 RepID=A0AAW1DRE4_ZOAVI